MIMRFKLSVSIFLLMICFVSSLIGADEGGTIDPYDLKPEKWSVATSPNFTIISNHRQKLVMQLARNLERFRKTIQIVTNIPLSQHDRPVKIIAAKGRNAFRIIAGDSISAIIATI